MITVKYEISYEFMLRCIVFSITHSISWFVKHVSNFLNYQKQIVSKSL